MTVGPRRVLVVGGGAGGVATAAALLRRAADGAAPVDVTLVERAAEVGPGLAYGTRDPHHLLNNYAGRMSALADDPSHLVRWCRAQGLDVTPETFVSRETYGRYLGDLVDGLEAPTGPGSRVLRDEVVDVTDAGSDYLATTATGAVLTADAVVLALGNPPPRRPRGLPVDAGAVRRRPVGPGPARPGRPARPGCCSSAPVSPPSTWPPSSPPPDPACSVTATSRHGLLPLHHVVEAPGPAPAFDADVVTLREVLGEVRRCLAAGADWRCVVESVKAVANELWTGFSLEDKERFTRHVARRWEIARHRMAPAMAEIVDDLLATGRLTVVPTSQVDPASYDLVVNCTGPAPVSSTGWNVLVDNLAVKGMLWPGPFGLGVDVDVDGALVDADGLASRGLYAVGAARRGVEWEVAAVPDIRRQAARLAEHLATADLDPVTELVG